MSIFIDILTCWQVNLSLKQIQNLSGISFENFRDTMNKFADFGLIALMPIVDDNTSLRFIRFEGNDFKSIVSKCNTWSQIHQLGNKCSLVDFMNEMTNYMRSINNRKRTNNMGG